jgi:poly(A)-specific ribonuclease
MGFSLVMKAIAEAKKPLIGHNCMYDWLYCHNQFVGPLPATYTEWIKEWNQLFPLTYDNKVLCQYSRYFHKTVLDILFSKCVNDESFKNVL